MYIVRYLSEGTQSYVCTKCTHVSCKPYTRHLKEGYTVFQFALILTVTCHVRSKVECFYLQFNKFQILVHFVVLNSKHVHYLKKKTFGNIKMDVGDAISSMVTPVSFMGQFYVNIHNADQHALQRLGAVWEIVFLMKPVRIVSDGQVIPKFFPSASLEKLLEPSDCPDVSNQIK